MPDEACRLAKVEQRIESLEEIFEDRGKKLDAIIATLEEMKNEQTRYKGFIGGIVFTIGALCFMTQEQVKYKMIYQNKKCLMQLLQAEWLTLKRKKAG
jgi:hypothetical protein